jgi:hypothetical protein
MYDKIPERYEDQVNNCHIYMIGETSKVNIINAEEIKGNVRVHINLACRNENNYIDIPMPEGAFFVDENKEQNTGWYIQLSTGEKIWPNQELIMDMISDQVEQLDFKVKYIGQAYGKDGNRNALERLREHRTLQKIAIEGVPTGKKLSLLLIDLADNQILTTMNPWSKDKKPENDKVRIKNGLDKLFNTTDAEKISLYEAAMIRYFQPTYNKQLKHSFPSTNLKILQDCYEKDFQAVAAELGFGNSFFRLWSEEVEAKSHHMVNFDLSDKEDRQSFFSLL